MLVHLLRKSKGDDDMTVFEAISLMIAFATLVVLIVKIRTTRKTGGLLTGYKPVVLGQRLKALAFTTFKPHSH